MADHHFLFALKLSGGPRPEAMLGDVAASVLGSVGYTPEAVGEMVGMLLGALEMCVAEGLRECEAQFRAEAGQLLIVLSYTGGREWRTTRPLP